MARENQRTDLNRAGSLNWKENRVIEDFKSHSYPARMDGNRQADPTLPINHNILLRK